MSFMYRYGVHELFEKIRLGASVGMLMGIAACASSEPVDVHRLLKEDMAKTLPPSKDTPYSTWLDQAISVCWEAPAAWGTERDWVRDEVEHVWSEVSGVHLTGWGPCRTGASGIRIQVSDEGPHVKALGRALDGYHGGLVLNFSFQNWGTECRDQREHCIRAIAVHEFGHAFGLTHSNSHRPRTLKQYVSTSAKGAQHFYEGLLQGAMWFRYASWCRHPEARLLLGDFNGDSRDDLLCHDKTGRIQIDYANLEGQFLGTDWARDADWCHQLGAELRIGDFNGDGQDDMLCHDPSGQKWIDYANQGGQFYGAEWYRKANDCNQPGVKMTLGDFNGDGRDDMLCYNQKGHRWIDYADAKGQFLGTDWRRDTGWCQVRVL